ncbi:MAG TPA: precorrin-6A reductase, partial [Clostridia bacterium]
DLADMTALIQNKKIECIVDASHPFARVVSGNAIKASGLTGVSYIRFERENINFEGDNLIKVKDFYEAADAASKIPGNIFLTIGANNLSIFTEKIPDFKKRLFARVLPDSRIIFKCEEAGLTAGNIIAVKGPFSKELNIEMLKHVKASAVVTKESGEAGGTLEKLEAASHLGIPVILVERPKVEYGAKASAIHDVLKLVEDMKRR